MHYRETALKKAGQKLAAQDALHIRNFHSLYSSGDNFETLRKETVALKIRVES